MLFFYIFKLCGICLLYLLILDNIAYHHDHQRIKVGVCCRHQLPLIASHQYQLDHIPVMIRFEQGISITENLCSDIRCAIAQQQAKPIK